MGFHILSFVITGVVKLELNPDPKTSMLFFA